MSNRAKLFIPIAFFLVMASLLLFGLGRDPNQVPSALVNRPLPEFSLPSLLDPSVTYTEEDLKGGGIQIVNFWATWCAPCHQEHPYLVDLSESEEGVSFVGVNYKNQGRSEDPVGYLEERGNPFKKVIVDPAGRLGIDMGVTGAPETFIVDNQGIIRYRHVGVIDFKIWEDTFEPVIRQLREEGADG